MLVGNGLTDSECQLWPWKNCWREIRAIKRCRIWFVFPVAFRITVYEHFSCLCWLEKVWLHHPWLAALALKNCLREIRAIKRTCIWYLFIYLFIYLFMFRITIEWTYVMPVLVGEKYSQLRKGFTAWPFKVTPANSILSLSIRQIRWVWEGTFVALWK